MKKIFRLSLALIVMSLFSVSYLVTSASADPGNHPPMGAPGYAPGTAPMGAPGMAPGNHPPMGAPGMAPGYAPPMGAPGMAPGYAPPMGAPGMAPGHAPPMGAPGMAPGYAPPMGAPGMAPGTTGEASGSSYTGLSQPGTGPHDGPGDHAPMGEDCAAKPTPAETAACWDRNNDPLLSR